MIPLATLALTLIVASTVAPQTAETPEQMADRLLSAIGGRARWAAVTNTVNDSQQNLVENPTVLRVVITMDFTRPRFRIDTIGPDARGEPYAFGAHANDAGTASGPWEFVHEGIHHPRWVSSPDGTWRAMIKTLAVNVPLTDEIFARPR